MSASTSAGSCAATAILPVSQLAFNGVRNQYRRDGIGTEMVAILPLPQNVDLGTREDRVQAGYFSLRNWKAEADEYR